MTPLLPEIHCDVCGRKFQTGGRPVAEVAASFGWDVTDQAVLCPCCRSALAELDLKAVTP